MEYCAESCLKISTLCQILPFQEGNLQKRVLPDIDLPPSATFILYSFTRRRSVLNLCVGFQEQATYVEI